MSATINIILDTRRIKKNDKYPIKLRVTFDHISEYYQTIFDLSKDDYDKLSASRISNKLQTIRDKLKDIERTAENSVTALNPFSFSDFKKDFIQDNILFQERKSKQSLYVQFKSEFDYSIFHKKFPILKEDYSTKGTIFFSYLNVIKKILREGRISSAMYYHCSYVSLKNLGVMFDLKK